MKTLFKTSIFTLLTAIAFSSYAEQETIPAGWYKTGNYPDGYIIGLDQQVSYSGWQSVFLKSKEQVQVKDKFAALAQTASLEEYKSQRVMLTAYAKSDIVDGWSGVWFRINGGNRQVLAFDNMFNRPITGQTDWQQYDLVLDIPQHAKQMTYGILLSGTGTVWLDNLSFNVVANSYPVTDMKLQKQPKPQPRNLDFENQ